MVQIETKCDSCANNSICKFVDNAKRTQNIVSDASKLIEAQHFDLSFRCTTYVADYKLQKRGGLGE